MSALAQEVVRLLRGAHHTLAVAETCTGGMLSADITSVPGSSSVLIGGLVPYADSVKIGLLGIDSDLIKRHGSVSGEVALALARSVRERLGASIGLAITGIAGPDGARPGKPVGLVFIALVDALNKNHVERHEWVGDRDSNRQETVNRALEMLQLILSAPAELTRYI